VSDDGRWVFVANWGAGENTVSVVDTSDWTQKFVKIPKIDQPCGLALSPDQKRVWVTGWTSKTVHTIDLGPLDLKPTKKAEPAPTTSASAAASTATIDKAASWASSMKWVPIVEATKKPAVGSTKL
jgi:DNA-binding beta-propeller fold protein YncE